jgi:hypothetical protein
MVFNFTIYALLVSTITMPGVTNPICDLYAGYCQSGQLGTAAGTTNGVTDTSTISPQQQAAQSCGIGGAIGLGIGALGFLAGPVGIITAPLGGLIGCSISSTFFPAQASGVLQSIKNSGGTLGDFTNALGNALQFMGSLLVFVPDSVRFMFALFGQFPEVGIWLFPFNGAMMVLLFMYLAEYVRGVNLGVG